MIVWVFSLASRDDRPQGNERLSVLLIFFLFGARVQVKVTIDAFHNRAARLVRIIDGFHAAGIAANALGADSQSVDFVGHIAQCGAAL